MIDQREAQIAAPGSVTYRAGRLLGALVLGVCFLSSACDHGAPAEDRVEALETDASLDRSSSRIGHLDLHENEKRNIVALIMGAQNGLQPTPSENDVWRLVDEYLTLESGTAEELTKDISIEQTFALVEFSAAQLGGRGYGSIEQIKNALGLDFTALGQAHRNTIGYFLLTISDRVSITQLAMGLMLEPGRTAEEIQILIDKSLGLETGVTKRVMVDSESWDESLKRRLLDEVSNKAMLSNFTTIEQIRRGMHLEFSFETPQFTVRPDITVDDYQIGDEFQDCAVCPEMVVVPPGSFLMGSSEDKGSDNEKPQHEVVIAQPFAVGKYEVARGEYAAFAATGGHKPGIGCALWSRGEWDPFADWEAPGFSQTDRDPAVCVSWDDAQAYVRWLASKAGRPYRLLSEAEWEYASRAGTTTRYFWGDKITPEDANYGGHVGKTTEVGSYLPNFWGLYDVHGNVWEWVEDCWNESYEGAPSDGSAWTSGECDRRVLRGGSWSAKPEGLRAAVRGVGGPDGRIDFLGIRVARMLVIP